MSKLGKERRKSPEFTEVLSSDLRALLFWAEYGIANAAGGSYEKNIENIIKSYANHLRFQVRAPRFGSLLSGRR